MIPVYKLLNDIVFEGVRYFISQPGKICSDSDNDYVNSYAECEKASAWAVTGVKKSKRVRNETLVLYPQGCMFNHATKEMVFNLDAKSEKRNVASAQVCKAGMTRII